MKKQIFKERIISASEYKNRFAVLTTMDRIILARFICLN